MFLLKLLVAGILTSSSQQSYNMNPESESLLLKSESQNLEIPGIGFCTTGIKFGVGIIISTLESAHRIGLESCSLDFRLWCYPILRSYLLAEILALAAILFIAC